MNNPIKSDLNVIDALKHLSVEDLQSEQKRRSKGFAVACLNLNGDLNVGVIMRNAVIFGAERMFIIGSRRYDKRSSVGTENYIEVVKLNEDNAPGKEISFSRDDFDKYMQEYSYTPIFIEQGSELEPKHSHQLYRPCFVFGNEGYGIPKSFIKDNDIIVSIPQIGIIRSLNVSSAAAIVLYEYSTTR